MKKDVDPVAQTPALTVDGTDFAVDSWFDVVNPATGQAFAQAPALGTDQLDAVFVSAERALRVWKRDDGLRQRALLAAADTVAASVSELAPLLTMEQGKPLREAREEILGASAWLRYYAELELSREIIRDDAQGYEEVFRRPMGVVSAITPWNYPVALATWKIAPALRAGNTIVVKPSPYTPLTTLELGRRLRGVFPDGVLNVVAGQDPLGAFIVSHPVPRKVSFTGSTATGKKVAAAASSDLKRITLELGGNDPAIVLGDADVDLIAANLFWGAFTNCGQICLAVKRVYAHTDIYRELVDALAETARSANVDDGLAERAQIGPINNKPQFERIDDLVIDARRHGARPVAGGAALDRDGYFFAPTILDNVSDGIRVVDEEQFGPVLPVISFGDESDAIERANKSQYGLTASVWSADREHAHSVAEQLDTGQVSVNGHGGGVQPHLPFGGHKWSGIGVENGLSGLYGFTELQVITGPPRSG